LALALMFLEDRFHLFALTVGQVEHSRKPTQARAVTHPRFGSELANLVAQIRHGAAGAGNATEREHAQERHHWT
jgi:hypothetical protein